MWIISAASMVLVGLALWPFFQIKNRAINLCALCLLIVSLTLAVQFLAGISSALTRSGVLLISLAVALPVLLFGRRQIFDSLTELGFYLRELSGCFKARPVVIVLLAVCVAVILARSLAHVWYLPPFIWDVHSYHLPKVADWIQNGNLQISENPVTRCYWPAGLELYQAWFMVFFHHDAFYELAGLPFYFIAIVSVFAICRNVGGGRAISMLMALAFAFTPALMMNSVSGKNDVAISALYIFIMALIADYYVTKTGAEIQNHLSQRSQSSQSCCLYRRVVLIASATLLGIGIKASMVFVYPGIIVAGVIVLMWTKIRRYGDRLLQVGKGESRNDDSLPAVCRSRTTVPRSETSIARCIQLAILSVILCLSSYWYVRNFFLFDNPFHPVDFKVAGNLIFGSGHGDGQQGSFSIHSLKTNLDALLGQRIYDGKGPIDPDLGNMAGWGWFAVSFIPVSIYGLFKNRLYVAMFTGFAISSLMLLGFVSPDPWNARFFTWFPAIIAVGAGVTLNSVFNLHVRRCLLIVSIICIFINILATLSNGYLKLQDWRIAINTPLFDRTSALNFDKYNPRTTAIGYMGSPNAMIYPLYGKFMDYKLKYMNVSKADELPAKMNSENVAMTYMIDLDGGWKREIGKLVADGRLIVVGDNKYALPEKK